MGGAHPKASMEPYILDIYNIKKDARTKLKLKEEKREFWTLQGRAMCINLINMLARKRGVRKAINVNELCIGLEISRPTLLRYKRIYGGLDLTDGVSVVRFIIWYLQKKGV